MAGPAPASCLYVGRVRHRRHRPVRHDFSMRLFMAHLDLAELPALFDRRLLWSAQRFNLMWFRRRDYFGDPALALDEALRDRVEADTGSRPAGPIRVLSHLRAFGMQFNPVSFYHCYDAAGARVETTIAEITNTPWLHRCAYVLASDDAEPAGEHRRWRFAKRFYVSPFNPLDMQYDWTIGEPGERHFVHMNVNATDATGAPAGKDFDATLELERRPMSGPAMAGVLARFPVMTAAVVARIYFEALRLRIKGAPAYAYPQSTKGLTDGGSTQR